MRTELEGIFNEETLLADLNYSLPAGTNCRLISARRKRIVILVTKEAHCLGDILMKNYYGALDVEIAAVIGNHDNLRELVERFDIPSIVSAMKVSLVWNMINCSLKKLMNMHLIILF